MSGLKIDAGYGRLYVTGPAHRALTVLPGATENVKRGAVELSLTLETLRAIRGHMQWTPQQLASCCTAPVMAWARAASRSEAMVNDMHQRLQAGWRARLPWIDTRAHLLAPENAAPHEVYVDDNGVRRYIHFLPFAHQEIMASVAITLDGSAFWCEMGTGKTRAAIEAMAERARRGELEYIIVFCPARVLPTWEREVKRWSRNLTPVVLTGSVQGRMDVLRQCAANRPPSGEAVVLICNYEVVYRMDTGYEALMEARRCGLLLDESHKVKNPQAKVTKAVLGLARLAQWKLAMSGSPHTGKDTDIWSQWYCVDLGIAFGANYTQFKREFFTENPYTFEMTPRQETPGILRTRMARRGLRYKKVDCLDLPPKLYERVELDMTAPQLRAYTEMAEQLVTRLDNGEFANASTALVAMMRLSQITSGFVKNEEGNIVRFTPNPKHDACVELVEELIEQGQSVILWAWYVEDIDRLSTALAAHAPALIRGGQKIADHAEAERRFQQRETKLVIANQASGGTGITLSAASAAIYYSQGYSMVDRLQSEDRCHRAGSQIHNKITYYDFIMRNTVDEVVYGAIARKIDAAALVVELRQSLAEAA